MQAKAICLLASREAKGGPGMVGIAGEYLNLILDELKKIRDLKINRVTATITATGGINGPFALEADYLRTYDMFYPLPSAGGAVVAGIPVFLHPITMEQYDAEFKSPSVANYPYEFATDLSTAAQTWDGGVANTTPGLFTGIGALTSAGLLYIYPQSSGNISLTHRYMKNQPDITTPETSTDEPWFPYADYLVKRTAARMMGTTGDDRQSTYLAECEEMLRPYLIQEGDEQQAVHEVKLDPRRFHFSKGLRPTKAYPF